MYGAILGDIVGSPYEFDCNNYKAKDFPLFSQQSEFTDDTVMTLAVAKALMDTRGQDDAAIKAALVREMQRLGCTYPDRGYGVRFGGWLYEDAPKPITATATAAPCGYLRRRGWEGTWRRCCIWRGLPPRSPTTIRRASRARRPPPRRFTLPAP